MDRRREPLPTRVQDTPELPAGYEDALRRGLDDLGLSLGTSARAAIDGHVRLLLAWTTAINLTAIRDPTEVAIRHVVDSLTALSWLGEHGVGRSLDLGSGGGFPGIPLAAAAPSLEVTLVEPIGKKARFLDTVTAAIGLGGRVTTRQARAEELGREPDERERWQAVTARAVASTADLVELAFPFLSPGGALLAWKRGDTADEVRSAARAAEALGGGSVKVLEVGVEGLGDHRLVVVTRDPSGRLPPGYPRDPAARRRHAF